MFFDSTVVLKDAIQNENITIQKCRKLAMIIGAPPEVFFKIEKKKAIPIESKAELVERFLRTPCNITIANYLPVVLQNMLGVGKNMGGKNANSTNTTSNDGQNTPLQLGQYSGLPQGPTPTPTPTPTPAPTPTPDNVEAQSEWLTAPATLTKSWEDKQSYGQSYDQSSSDLAPPDNTRLTIGIAIALLLFLFKKGLKHYRLYNMVAKDEKMIRDKVFAIKLKNNGVYNGCLKESDLIHQIFKKSFLKNESIEKLRYRLLTEWETSYFSQYYLQSIHLIRENGKMRSTAEEIGNAILYHTSIFGLPSKGINYLFGRRKSSQSYLQYKKRKSSSKNQLPKLKRKSSSKKQLPRPKRKSSSKKQLSQKSSYFKSSRSMSQKQPPQRRRSSYLKHSR